MRTNKTALLYKVSRFCSCLPFLVASMHTYIHAFAVIIHAFAAINLCENGDNTRVGQNRIRIYTAYIYAPCIFIYGRIFVEATVSVSVSV